MTAQEIFQQSVQVMKEVFGAERVAGAIKRARERGADGNRGLLLRERERINTLVVAIAGGSAAAAHEAPPELIDGMVLRYLHNRDLFMRTFPEGIKDVDADPVELWAAVMISPDDERPL